MDFFFDASRFMTRDCCGTWNEFVKAEYIISNLLISVSYFVVPICLYYFRDVFVAIKDDKLFQGLIAALFICCGIGHFENVISFVWTQYHLFAQWHLLMAIISWLAIARFIQIGMISFERGKP